MRFRHANVDFFIHETVKIFHCSVKYRRVFNTNKDLLVKLLLLLLLLWANAAAILRRFRSTQQSNIIHSYNFLLHAKRGGGAKPKTGGAVALPAPT